MMNKAEKLSMVEKVVGFPLPRARKNYVCVKLCNYFKKKKRRGLVIASGEIATTFLGHGRGYKKIEVGDTVELDHDFMGDKLIVYSKGIKVLICPDYCFSVIQDRDISKSAEIIKFERRVKSYSTSTIGDGGKWL